MLHSTGIGARQWQPYFQLLKNRHLIAINLLGYPPSDTWHPDFDISADLEGVEALVLQQQQPVNLIGHSYGGFLAMQVARKHPDSVHSLLLHEPVAWGSLFDSPRVDLQQHFHSICHMFFSAETRSCADTWLEGFVDFWNRPGTWKSLPDKTRTIWQNQFTKVYAEVKTLCLDRTPLAHWAAIEQPTCITLAEQSPEGEKEVCRLLSTTLPNCHLRHHPGGHMSPITHFKDLAPIITEWCREYP